MPGATTKRFGRRYPWEEWFSQKEFHLRQGIDFNGRVDTMDQQVRNAAGPERHNMAISVTIDSDGKGLRVKVFGSRERKGKRARQTS